MKILQLLTLIAVTGLTIYCNSIKKSNAKIIWLDGQSNNKGKGLVSELPSYLANFEFTNQFIWFNNEFQILEIGVNHIGNTLAADGSQDFTKFGPILQLAYRRQRSGQATYFVYTGRGGKRLIQNPSDVDFSPSSTDELHDTGISCFLNAKSNLESQGKTVNVLKKFWYQGEADGEVDQATADAYEANLTNKIAADRSDSNLSDLEYVIIRLHDGQTAVDYLTTIQTAQENVVGTVSGTSLLNINTCEVGGDFLHLTTTGQITLGDLYFASI